MAKYNKGRALMLKVIASCIMLFFLGCPVLMAQYDDSPANLNQYQWQNRVILVFADSKESDQYQKQVQEFTSQDEGFQDRDLITFHLFSDGNSFLEDQDISKQDVKKLQKRFKIQPGSFAVILLGKDGTEKLRAEERLSTDKLFNIIDAMPMRQR
jgi:hypothetical protein